MSDGNVHTPFLIKRLLGILLAAFSLLLILLGSGFLFLHFNKENIKRGLIHYVQERQQGEIRIGDIQFSPLTHLPHLTIRIDGLQYYEHPPEKRPEEAVPILDIDRAYLAFNIWPLLSGKYDISEVTLAEGDIHLTVYPDHSFNLFNAFGIRRPRARTIARRRVAPAAIELILDVVRLANLNIHLEHQGLGLSGEVRLHRLNAGLRYGEGVDDIQLATSLEVRHFLVQGQRYLEQKDIRLNLDIAFDEQSMVSRVRRSEMVVEGLTFDLAGTYTFDRTGWIDLRLDASDEDLTLLSYLIEDDLLHRNLKALREGNLYLNGTIRGKTVNHFPEVTFRFGAENLRLEIPGRQESIKDLGFSGVFTTGEADDFSEGRLQIFDLQGELPGGYLCAGLDLSNLRDPILSASIDLAADLKGWDKLFKLGKVDSLAGRIALKADVLEQRVSRPADLLRETESFGLDLKGLSFHLPAFPHRFRRIRGHIGGKEDELIFKNIKLRYGRSRLTLSGGLQNIVARFSGKKTGLKADLQLNIDSTAWDQWPFFDTLQYAIAGEEVTDLYVELSARTGAGLKQNYPWPKRVFLQVNQLKGDFKLLPDIDNLQAGGLVDFRRRGGLWFNLRDLTASTPSGPLKLQGGKIAIADGAVYADSELYIKGFHPYHLPPVRWQDQTLRIFTDTTLRIEARLPLKGSYRFRSRRIDSLEIRLGQVAATYQETKNLTLEKIDLHLDKVMFHPEAVPSHFLSALEGGLSVENIRTESVNNVGVTFDISGRKDYYLIRGNLRQFSEVRQSGSIEVDLSTGTPTLEFDYHIGKLPVERFSKILKQPKQISGLADLSLHFVTKGQQLEDWLQQGKGSLILEGRGLVLHGVDLEQQLRRFRRSSPFGLAGMSSYLMANPFQQIIAGGRTIELPPASGFLFGKTTDSVRLVSAWEFEAGEVHSREVWLATPSARLALEGQFDLSADSIRHLQVAFVDENGCPLLKQSIYGPFRAPQVGPLNGLEPSMAPVENVLEWKAQKPCVPFLKGKAIPVFTNPAQ